MTGTVEKAVVEIKRGRQYPVYFLYGDESLAKAGAKAIIEALVHPDRQPLNVETVQEEADLASLPLRLHTVPLFGGVKLVAVYDSKAFISKQNLGNLGEKSFEAWQAGEVDRATRLFLQVVGAAGEGESFLGRAAQGEIAHGEWERVLSMEAGPETERWLREVAGRALADGMAIPEVSGAGMARIYEEAIQRGIPPSTSLILTAEVVDERRALFKKISAVGFVIDCGARRRRPWDTQMDPEAARSRIRELVATDGKSIGADAIAAIVDRTGFSVRSLESEIQKLLLYIGTRPTITVADVLEVFSTSREANIFDLTNAVSGRDAARAIRAFRSLMAQREPIPPLLGMLAAEIRGLIVARGALERQLKGVLDPEMPYPAFQARILPLLAKGAEGDDGSAARLLAMKPFRAFSLLKAATAFSMADLVRALEAIHETDLALKTSGHPEDLLIERLLLSVCAGG